MLPRNGKALSQPHDAWPVLALGAYLLRCRDKAVARNGSGASTSAGGSVYIGTRAFLPLLLTAEEGHIVNTSSVNGF